MSGGKFLKPWQVTDKIIEWNFSQFTLNLQPHSKYAIINYHNLC